VRARGTEGTRASGTRDLGDVPDEKDEGRAERPVASCPSRSRRPCPNRRGDSDRPVSWRLLHARGRPPRGVDGARIEQMTSLNDTNRSRGSRSDQDVITGAFATSPIRVPGNHREWRDDDDVAVNRGIHAGRRRRRGARPAGLRRAGAAAAHAWCPGCRRPASARSVPGVGVPAGATTTGSLGPGGTDGKRAIIAHERVASVELGRDAAPAARVVGGRRRARASFVHRGRGRRGET